jgi:SPP1 family predicted phage head-tail adaptor
VRIGLFDRRVVIETVTEGADAAGQVTEAWAPVATVWMRIKPQRGQERFTARQVLGTAVITFEARYRSDLTVNKHRLVHDGATFDIHDIRENGRRRLLEIDATARSEG